MATITGRKKTIAKFGERKKTIAQARFERNISRKLEALRVDLACEFGMLVHHKEATLWQLAFQYGFDLDLEKAQAQIRLHYQELMELIRD